MTPTPPRSPVPPQPPAPDPFGGKARILLGLGAAVFLAALITLIVVITNDEDDTALQSGSTTSTTEPVSSSSTSDTTVPSSTATSTSTVAPSAMPVVVADGYILGYWDGQDWVRSTVDEGDVLPAPPVESGTPYLFVDGGGGELRTALGEIEDGCHLGNSWAVFDDSTRDRVGLPLAFDAVPRAVTETAAAADHEAAVASWLASEGSPDSTVSIDRVVRVDLDGDGRDEVFIEASHGTEETVQEQAGAYSVLLYRYVDADDAAQTVVVGGDVVTEDDAGSEFAFVFTHRLLGILDLNQDGSFEVVTKTSFYEGVSVAASTVRGPRLTEVLATGCGS